MKTKFTALSLLLLLALITGCQKKESGGVSIKTRSESLTPEAGSTFVSVTATLDWNITLEFPGGGSWATIEPASGTGTKSDILLKYEANTSEEPRTLVLVLNGMGAEARTSLIQNHKGGGVMGNYGYDTVPAELNWLELPATVAGDGRQLLIHRMDGKKYRSSELDDTRNYSAYWDFDDHLSLWVAYPLNPDLHGSEKFDYVWGFDPMIPSNLQPNIIERSYGGYAYGGGKWNRGHQIPKADRQTSEAAVASTCYPTNMTPQDGTFNSGIWVSLESKVRGYIAKGYKKDTLFVVTGCLFDQSTKYTEPYSDTRFKVKIPTHYFKALLYAGHDSDEAKEHNGTYYKAAGFLLPHDPSLDKNDVNKYILSIDQLEDKTGIDFFPNLAKRIDKDKADLVEAATPGSWWKK